MQHEDLARRADDGRRRGSRTPGRRCPSGRWRRCRGGACDRQVLETTPPAVPRQRPRLSGESNRTTARRTIVQDQPRSTCYRRRSLRRSSISRGGASAMTLDQALAFVLFAIVAAITPGPSNIILTVDGRQRRCAARASLPLWGRHRDGADDVRRGLRAWESGAREPDHPARSQVGRGRLPPLAVMEDRHRRPERPGSRAGRRRLLGRGRVPMGEPEIVARQRQRGRHLSSGRGRPARSRNRSPSASCLSSPPSQAALSGSLSAPPSSDFCARSERRGHSTSPWARYSRHRSCCSSDSRSKAMLPGRAMGQRTGGSDR